MPTSCRIVQVTGLPCKVAHKRISNQKFENAIIEQRPRYGRPHTVYTNTNKMSVGNISSYVYQLNADFLSINCHIINLLITIFTVLIRLYVLKYLF